MNSSVTKIPKYCVREERYPYNSAIFTADLGGGGLRKAIADSDRRANSSGKVYIVVDEADRRIHTSIPSTSRAASPSSASTIQADRKSLHTVGKLIILVCLAALYLWWFQLK
ncbi:hypothetical protein V5279_24420 [Bradyrhizobium sp. 26S5]|uniref:hypothetical protein n=1 Tax=Bradyrhizobium sp. 26S5 TaxID=3139729 RepID=UPI0030D4ABCD